MNAFAWYYEWIECICASLSVLKVIELKNILFEVVECNCEHLRVFRSVESHLSILSASCAHLRVKVIQVDEDPI